MLGGALLYLRKIVGTQEELKKRLDIIALLEPGQKIAAEDDAVDPQVGLPIGAPVPEFELRAVDGGRVSLASLRESGRPSLLFFVSPTCEPCKKLLPDFLEWREELSDRANVFFVSSGKAAENKKKFADLENVPVLLDPERQFAKSVGGRWTPTALFIDASGNVASHVAAGDLAIEDLVAKVKRADLSRPFTNFPNANRHERGLKIGTEAPDFSLPDISGTEVTKQALLGKKTLVTFWSPTCPHCTSFLEELREWESTQKNGHPSLMLISDGEPGQHKDLGLRAPVLLDKGHKIAAKLGMSGTPSAVLIDETGTITTETGTGAANIWALIGRHTNGSN
jgi:peroxiredoxin